MSEPATTRLGVPPLDNAQPGDAVSVRLIALVRMLRERGVASGSGAVLRAHDALQVVDPTSSGQCYVALRSVLCSRREHLAAFDTAFHECFGDGLFDHSGPPPGAQTAGAGGVDVVPIEPRAEDESRGGAGEEPDGPAAEAAVWSPAEILRQKDFADYTTADEAAALAEIRRLAAVVPHRRSRRLRRCHREVERVQMRQTLRTAMRHGGEVTDLTWQKRSTAPRPLVLVCDVSASMAPYTRMLMLYLHAAVLHGRRVEAFVFGTRMTRVTGFLGARHHATALARITESATDWGAGTRIGESIGQLNRRWGARIGRGAIVIILSDGWDRGDPRLLAAEMARLRRCSHSLVWLNPRAARPGFEPLVRGLRAALPETDIFESGNSLAALQRLNSILEAR
jgi:uncharacterized protein